MRCEERQKQPKTDKSVILKGDCSLDTLFKVIGGTRSRVDFSQVRVHYVINETMHTLKELPGTSKTAKKDMERVIFKRGNGLDAVFSRLLKRL